MLLLLLISLLTLIISAHYFIFPFVVSQNLSSLYIITADLCAAQMSRLILNLLEANCPLDESIDSSTIESLRFRHSESTRDTESDISWGDRGSIEGIHKEARWLEDSMYFIRVDDVRCILRTDHSFVCTFSTTWVVMNWARVDTIKTRRSDKVNDVILDDSDLR